MIVHATMHKIIRIVVKQAESRSFIPLVGAVALLSTLSMSVPVEWLVVISALASRRRWILTASAAAVGSAVGSLGLYLLFHHFGWNLLLERYPELAESGAWLQATDWLSNYGLLALFGLMAVPLPIPKLPMLAIAGIYRLPILEVFVAIVTGKAIKYLGYAYIAIRFPGAVRGLTENVQSLVENKTLLRRLRSARLRTLAFAGEASVKMEALESSELVQSDKSGSDNFV